MVESGIHIQLEAVLAQCRVQLDDGDPAVPRLGRLGVGLDVLAVGLKRDRKVGKGQEGRHDRFDRRKVLRSEVQRAWTSGWASG